MAKILTENEVIEQSNISKEEFESLKKDCLVTPKLKNDKNLYLYGEDTLQAIEKIIHLKNVGFSTKEIKKIVKKVGLPITSKAEAKENSNELLTVGALAEQIGVNARTIKHWEEKGIFDSDTRSEGGFRLYQEIYVYFGQLILDLQMFGYSLDEIKIVSDMFRDFVAINSKIDVFPSEVSLEKLELMKEKISELYKKMNELKEGINRWDELLKKKKKEISNLQLKIKKQRLSKGKK